MTRLNEIVQSADATRQLYQRDLQLQADIAKEAQLNYERELVKHGEATATLQSLRGQLRTFTEERIKIQKNSEYASAALITSEASWQAQKEDYEREMQQIQER